MSLTEFPIKNETLRKELQTAIEDLTISGHVSFDADVATRKHIPEQQRNPNRTFALFQ